MQCYLKSISYKKFATDSLLVSHVESSYLKVNGMNSYDRPSVNHMSKIQRFNYEFLKQQNI